MFLTKGALYEVLEEDGEFYRIVDDSGDDYLYPAYMFRPVTGAERAATPMFEFLITRPGGDDWFELDMSRWAGALHPRSESFQVVKGEGHRRILVGRAEVAFFFETPGIQACVYGRVDRAEATRVLKAVCENLRRSIDEEPELVCVS